MSMTNMPYDRLFKKARIATQKRLLPICGLSATRGRNTIIDDNKVNKLVDMFQMNLITPEFSGKKEY